MAQILKKNGYIHVRQSDRRGEVARTAGKRSRIDSRNSYNPQGFRPWPHAHLSTRTRGEVAAGAMPRNKAISMDFTVVGLVVVTNAKSDCQLVKSDDRGVTLALFEAADVLLTES